MRRSILAALLIFALAACDAHQEDQASDPGASAGLEGVPITGVTVYAAGDIADCRRVPASKSGAATTAHLLASRLEQSPDAVVLTLGDHTYPLGTLEEFHHCYGPTWGRFRDRTYPAPGNHEYYSPLAGGYYAYFGERAGPGRRGYYSFRLGDWHVVSLNSVLQGEQMQAQLAWLRADLARNPSRCILAYWHHPRYSSGGHGDDPRMRAFWAALYEARADVVLSAHDHGYERFARQDADAGRDEQGMRQFVVGTGGAQLTLFRRTHAHSEARQNGVHGVLKLVLARDSYAWEFLPSTDGYSDRGAARCNGMDRRAR